MDVAGAAYHRLCTEPTIIAAVDQRLYRHKLPVVMEGTHSAAAVLSHARGWRPAPTHQTLRYPKLRLELYVDSSAARTFDAESRADAIWRAFDEVLHQPRGINEDWGGARVIGSVRVSDYELFPVTDSETTALLACDYALTML